MEIKADKILTIKVGTTIELTMNGNNGTVTLQSTKAGFDIKDSIDMKANAGIKTSAANISHEANGMLKISSNGLVNVQGSPIKLG